MSMLCISTILGTSNLGSADVPLSNKHANKQTKPYSYRLTTNTVWLPAEFLLLSEL